MNTGFVSVVISSLFLTPFPKADKVNVPDYERIQGIWVTVKFYMEGIDGTGWSQGEAIDIFKDRTKTLKNSLDPKLEIKETFRLDATKCPKRITIIKEDGTEFQGIYEFDKDFLRIAMSGHPSRPPPESFQPRPNNIVYILRFLG